MIKFTKEKNNYFYLLQIDQEKAFDKIDRNVLFKTMQKLGVSPLYINFIKTYTNNTSTIINNGFLSSPISLETDKQRSHHQLIETPYIKKSLTSNGKKISNVLHYHKRKDTITKTMFTKA